MDVDVCYPPRSLNLSATTIDALEQLADQFVAETLSASDEFIAQGHVVDNTRWKTLKKKDNITAFRSRNNMRAKSSRPRIASEDTDALAASPEMPEFYPATNKNIENAMHNSYLSVSTTCPEDNDIASESLEKFNVENVLEWNTIEKSRHNSTSMIFCTGSIPGTVEDAALGFLADTEVRSRERVAKCTEANVSDARILTCIQGPSFDDPFRFLGVKWLTLSSPGATKYFIKPRDFLILESTGMALDSDGERFTYFLVHSIVLDEVPEFRRHGLVRQTVSVCHIIRPHSNNGEVEVFSRGFTGSVGGLAERAYLSQYCDGMMAVPKMIEEACTRKLVWMLQSQASGCRSFRLASTSVGQAVDTCQSCNDKANKGVGMLFDYSICVLCRHSMCRKCTIKKLLSQEVGSKEQAKVAIKFCLKCYLEAKHWSAWDVGLNSLSVTDQA